MVWRALGRWRFRHVARVVGAWLALSLGALLLWATLTTRAYVGTDTYVVVHLTPWIALIIFGPPTLLMMLWLWRRRRGSRPVN
jgi:hypothetical protein